MGMREVPGRVALRAELGQSRCGGSMMRPLRWEGSARLLERQDCVEYEEGLDGWRV